MSEQSRVTTDIGSPHKTANQRQVDGGHYGGVPFQHWDIVIAHDLNYFEAQILRYVMRCRKKAGLVDLQKAHHFIEKYMEEWENVNRLPAEVVRVLPRSQADIDKEYEEQQEAAAAFQPDGFFADGRARFQCSHCRRLYLARSPLGALAQHGGGLPCTLPVLARPEAAVKAP